VVAENVDAPKGDEGFLSPADQINAVVEDPQIEGVGLKQSVTPTATKKQQQTAEENEKREGMGRQQRFFHIHPYWQKQFRKDPLNGKIPGECLSSQMVFSVILATLGGRG
jgi:hypothetical protein